MMSSIYLDNNATTVFHPAAREAMLKAATELGGNPSSSHFAGRKARRVLEDSREQIAELLGAAANEVIFTSGATEANNLAIFGLIHVAPGHLLASSVEHPSVHAALEFLSKNGFHFDLVPVDIEGQVSCSAMKPLLHEDTRLACVMLANHETGAVQDIKSLSSALPQNVLFHCDAAAAAGKIPVDFRELNVTSMTISGHKFHGPSGIGALLLRSGTKLEPLFHGGHQQQGFRPGTEPVALAVGMCTALELAVTEMNERTEKVLNLRYLLWNALSELAAPIVLNGPVQGGIPHTLNVSFPGCQADVLLMNLDLAGVACSTGSACSSGSLLPSPVLQAMGVSGDVLHSAMRFSLSHLLDEADVKEAAGRISKVVRRLRAESEDDSLGQM